MVSHEGDKVGDEKLHNSNKDGSNSIYLTHNPIKNDLWKRVFMERRKMTRNYIIGWERWKNDKTAGKCFGYL